MAVATAATAATARADTDVVMLARARRAVELLASLLLSCEFSLPFQMQRSGCAGLANMQQQPWWLWPWPWRSPLLNEPNFPMAINSRDAWQVTACTLKIGGHLFTTKVGS